MKNIFIENKSLLQSLALAILLLFMLILESCGGGPTTGISGTGNTISYGSIDGLDIDGFGSVLVNGVKFKTDSASILLDGKPGRNSDLRIGMVVKVQGKLNEDKITGTAIQIEFNDQIQGPIRSITESSDKKTKTLNVLDVEITVDNVTTHYDDISFDTLSVNDVVEISGFFDSNNKIKGTRVNKKGAFIDGVSEINIKGRISNLTDTTFTLNTLTVDFSSLEPPALTNNVIVEVDGALLGTTLVATEIEIEDTEDDLSQYESVFIEGVITDYTDISNFAINNKPVDASSAELSPSDLALKKDLHIKAIGVILNETLAAQTVEVREGDIILEAPVKIMATTEAKTLLTLGFNAGDINITVNNQTVINSEQSSIQTIKAEDIRAGDFLKIRAIQHNSDTIATKIDVVEPNDQFIQGPVDSFIKNRSINILGLTFATQENTSFESDDDSSTQEVFYSALMNGHTIAIKDKKPADSIADEVSKFPF